MEPIFIAIFNRKMIFQPPHALGFHFQIGVCGVTTEFFSLEYSLQFNIEPENWAKGKLILMLELLSSILNFWWVYWASLKIG